MSLGHFRCSQGDIYFSQLCTKGDRGTILIGFNFWFCESGSDWALQVELVQSLETGIKAETKLRSNS